MYKVMLAGRRKVGRKEKIKLAKRNQMKVCCAD
jgi:hypothetical protein